MQPIKQQKKDKDRGSINQKSTNNMFQITNKVSVNSGGKK